MRIARGVWPILSATVLLFAVDRVGHCEEHVQSVVDRTGRFYKAYSWTEPGGRSGPRGLRLDQVAFEGHVNRLLVFEPERQWRLILTDTLDPRRGLQVTELRDDVSGWWFRLESWFEVRGETVGTFIERVRALPPVDEATGFNELRLTTSDGFAFEPRIPRSEFEFWEAFFGQLQAADLVGGIASRVPKGFRAAVLFSDVSLMEEGSMPGVVDRQRMFPGLLGLMGRILRASMPGDDPRLLEFATPWKMSIDGGGKGWGIVEADLLELTSHFRSIENADPLAGSRVEDFAAPAPPP